MVRGTPGDRGIGAVGIVIGLLVLLVVGIVAAVVVGPLGAPSVSGVSNHFGGVTAEETTVVSEVTVENPNPIGFGSGDVSIAYAVDMNGIRMASGGKDGVSVDTGTSTIGLETAIRNDNISDWWVSHLQRGERSRVVVHATVSSGALGSSVDAPKVREQVSTDITSSFNTTERRPIEADKEPVVQDPVLYVEETSGWWGPVTDETTTVRMRFRVTNPKPYPIPIQEVRYDVGMNDIQVGQGATERSYVIPAGGSRTIEADLALRNDAFDDWWVSHLERNQHTTLAMDLSLVVDLSNGGDGTVVVPIDTIEHEIDTDVFGNKDRYPTGDGSSTTGDGSGDGTPTADDGSGDDTASDGGDGGDDTPTDSGATDPPTATPTDSPTPTPTDTPTDDGLLGVRSPRLRVLALR